MERTVKQCPAHVQGLITMVMVYVHDSLGGRQHAGILVLTPPLFRRVVEELGVTDKTMAGDDEVWDS